MPFSRRSFLTTLGAGGAALAVPFVSARGMEAALATPRGLRLPFSIPEVRLDSNENPYGPAPAALEAIQGMFSEACRYPDAHNEHLMEAIAAHLQVPADHLLLGAGSSEILRVAVDGFTSASRGLVSAAPTFELPADRAQVLGVPVTAVPVDAGLQLDLERMAAAAKGAGLVFLCNPNNPTATVHGAAAMREAIDTMLRASPDAVILVDEAYHEYVEDPDYRSFIPLTLEEPRVIVSRTFSKVYGMAGLRVGYAVGRPATLARMRRNILSMNVNVLAAAAAWTSLTTPGHVAAERAKNREAKAFARRFFEERGYTVTPSATNFFMVDIRRPLVPFRAACQARGIMVGRPFPPFSTYMRLSIGTMNEMRQATAVFAELLG